MQFDGGVLHRASIFHAQLPQDAADIGLHRGQLDAQNLPDLRVALMVAEQAQRNGIWVIYVIFYIDHYRLKLTSKSHLSKER